MSASTFILIVLLTLAVFAILLTLALCRMAALADHDTPDAFVPDCAFDTYAPMVTPVLFEHPAHDGFPVDT